MRIGLFGGTFDPVHTGHLVVAEQAREQGQLDQVWFIPSARPPHKSDLDVTAFDRRVAMLTLAIAGLENSYKINEIEKDRQGFSFTADTLDQLHQMHPEHEWFLILGADALRDMPGWHDPQRIVRRATLLVADRAGYPIYTVEEFARAIGMDVAQVRLIYALVPTIDFSSRDIRRRVTKGQSIRFLVPKPVEAYIHEKSLYRH